MDIAPAGTLDPTPTLYNNALYSMSGLLACAFICNAMIKCVRRPASSTETNLCHETLTLLGALPHPAWRPPSPRLAPPSPPRPVDAKYHLKE